MQNYQFIEKLLSVEFLIRLIEEKTVKIAVSTTGIKIMFFQNIPEQTHTKLLALNNFVIKKQREEITIFVSFDYVLTIQA